MERLNQKNLFPSFSSCIVGICETISSHNSDSESLTDVDEIYPGGSDESALESSLNSSSESSLDSLSESLLDSSLDSSDEEKTRSEDAMEEDLGGAGGSDESALKSSLEEKTLDAIEEDLGGAGGSEEKTRSEDAMEEDLGGAGGSDESALKSSLEEKTLDAIEEAKDGQVSEFVSLDPENIDTYGPLDKGKKVNMISLLSSSSRDFLVDKNGCQVKVSSLKDRYVFIHCFTLPVHSYSRRGNICWMLKSACSKWSNVQLVVVCKMSSGMEHDFEAFHSFVSAFPSCLTIPFEDSYSYNRVSHFIGFEDWGDALVLDPNGTVLQQRCNFMIHHGRASFPFTDDHLSNLFDIIENLSTERPVPLEYLLGLQLSDCLSNAAADDTISVSDLKQKLVGLYLCFDGEQLDTFNRKCQECQANNRELVIVLVYCSFSDDPQHFMACTNAVLIDKNISWWVLPFDDSTVCRLWQLCRESEKDELIIVGPQGEFLELKAGTVITKFKPDYDMYPYACESLAHQETARLKKLTVESLLRSTKLLTRKGDLVHVSELRGKNVVLFIANLRYESVRSYARSFARFYSSSTLKSMAIWCSKNEGYEDSDTKLVLVPINASKSKFDFTMSLPWLQDSAMSWLICPPDPRHKASIIKHLTVKGTQCTDELSFISFGEDGHIISTAYPVLSKFRSNDFLPDQLYQDVLVTYTDFLED